MSIKLKLVLLVAASMGGLTAATATLVRHVSEQNIAAAATQSIGAAARALRDLERADVEKLDTTLAALSANPDLARAFEARDREKFLSVAAPIFQELKQKHDVTHFYVHEPEPARTNFVRVHKPAQFGDKVDRATLTQAIETKGLGAGKELGQTAFALRVVRPWVIGGKVAGYLELGEEITHFLGRLKAQTGDDYGLLVEKRFLDEKLYANSRQGRRNNWADHPEVVALDTTTGDEGILAHRGGLSSLPEGGVLLEEASRNDRTLVRGIVPVADAAGHNVGGLFVVHDITALHESMIRDRNLVIGLFAGAALVLSGVLLALFHRLVVHRLEVMRSSLEDVSARLAGGDYRAASALPPPGHDEIGQFEEFFGGFVAVIGDAMREMEKRAGKAS